jgi:hypothetical protein
MSEALPAACQSVRFSICDCGDEFMKHRFRQTLVAAVRLSVALPMGAAITVRRACAWSGAAAGAAAGVEGVAWALALLLAVGASITPAGAVTLMDLVADPLLQQSLHRRLVTDRVDAAGAVGVNRDGAARWFIEEQRAGADFVQRGMATGNPEWVATGWRILDWGIARQAPDGDFPGTGDPFHSVSFFVESLARALSLNPAAATSGRVDAVRRAAEWLMRPDIAKRGEAHNRPYTHRRWILAAALGLTGHVTGEQRFMTAARTYTTDGLQLQTANGVNPEKGGADVGYQMGGVVMAARFVAAAPDPSMQRAVIAMIERAARWEAACIREDGTVDATGSTRILIETGRDGRVKGVPDHLIVEGFAYAATLTGNASFREIGDGWPAAEAGCVRERGIQGPG